MDNELNSSEYKNWIIELKSKIHAARRKVAYSINSQLLEMYWEIGKEISEKQEKSKWGSKFIEQTALELKHEFPEIKGFSRRNLYAIRQWYKFYSTKYQFVPQSVAQIPWGHNRLIITKIKNIEEAEFYCNETIKNGWDKLFNNICFEINNIPRKVLLLLVFSVNILRKLKTTSL